jgi:hypothetical protein
VRWRALTVFLFGCGRTAVYEPAQHAPHVVPHDAGVPDAGAPDAGTRDAGVPDAGIVPMPWNCETADAGEPSANACEATVVAGTITPSSPVCFVDVVPSEGEVGKVRWDCGAPSGFAEVIFSRATFHGIVNDGVITVCVGTTFPWSDGCQWSSAQHIDGDTAPGSTLTLTYAESPDPGQTGCFFACSASGPITVQ